MEYGPNSIKPEMEPDLLNNNMDEFLTDRVIIESERNIIQEKTVDQSISLEWNEIRRKKIDSSIFGKICNMLPYTR